MRRSVRVGAWLAVAVLAVPSLRAWASNDYYTHGSFPATGSVATSAGMRAELDLITAGFNKLPGLTGNNGQAVVVNSTGTDLTLTVGALALGGNFTTSGAYATTLTMTAATTLTLPTTGTLSTLAGTESLSNKTLVSPVLSGTVTGTYTLGGTQTISSPILSGTVTGTYTLGGTPTISSPILSGTVTGTYTLGGTPTLGSQLNLNGQTVLNTGTLTFPTSTDTLVGRATTDTLTNKTLTSPVIQGTVSAGTGLTMPAFAAAGTISGATGITSVGTLTTGVWNATAVSATYGGTGIDSHLSSGIPSLNAGAWSINNVLTTNQILYGAASNTVTSSSNLTYNGTSFSVGTAGPHAIGGATGIAPQWLQTGSYTPASGADAYGYQAAETLNPLVNGNGFGVNIAVTLNKASSGTHTDFAAMYLQPPTIGAGAAALTNASTLKITGTPSVGTNTYGLWNVGSTRLDGVTIIGANNSTLPTGAVYWMARDSGGNWNFNVPTGSNFSFNQNNTAVMTLTNGIFLLHTVVMTGGNVGDIALNNGANLRMLNAAGTTQLSVLQLDASNNVNLGANTTSVVKVGSPASVVSATAGDLLVAHGNAFRFANNAGTGTVIALSANSSDQLLLGSSQHLVPTGTADTVALLSATQTLTNKTLTSPTINTSFGGNAILGVSQGGLGISTTPSNGSIPIGNGTDYTAATLTAAQGISITNAAGAVTVGTTHSLVSLTASQSWTVPAGVTLIRVTLYGGGAGGGGGGGGAGTAATHQSIGGSGTAGGNGALVRALIPVTPSASLTVTIGAAGAAGSGGASNGNTGNAPSVGGNGGAGNATSLASSTTWTITAGGGGAGIGWSGLGDSPGAHGTGSTSGTLPTGTVTSSETGGGSPGGASGDGGNPGSGGGAGLAGVAGLMLIEY